MEGLLGLSEVCYGSVGLGHGEGPWSEHFKREVCVADTICQDISPRINHQTSLKVREVVKKCGQGLSPMSLESQAIQVTRVTMGSRCKPEPMELVLAVVLLTIVGPNHTSVLLFVLVEEFDGAFPT